MKRREYEAEICSRLKGAERVPFKQIMIDGQSPQIAKCHENVDAYVAANSGCIAVRGWVTYADFIYAIGLTAHSVIQGPDGATFDITPLADERLRDGMLFVRHNLDDKTFNAMKDANLNINCPI